MGASKVNMGKGRSDAKDGAAIVVYICIACCFVAPFFMWLIWGSIITNKADDWKDSGTCRAEEFWWMQVSAYISVGVFVCATSALQAIDKEGNNDGHMKAVPQTPPAIAVGLLRIAWFIGYSIYAIVLWNSLGDQ